MLCRRNLGEKNFCLIGRGVARGLAGDLGLFLARAAARLREGGEKREISF